MGLSSKQQTFLEGVRTFLCDEFGEERGTQMFDTGTEFSSKEEMLDYFRDILLDIRDGTFGTMNSRLAINAMTVKPVDVETFLLDKYYLGLEGEVYPVILSEMKEINTGKYVEALFTGAIGTAKTTMALWTTAYQLYLLSCMDNPQKVFGIARTDEILLIFQSISAKLAKSLDYARFRALIERSPYFKEQFPFDKDLESELQFPHRIIVRPVSGADTAAIGQNVIGGVIDELNYMAVVEKSKASVDGGMYDQAVALYNSIARRRKSRFMKQGKLPGILCLVSSKRYPGQFTDRKEEEAKTDPTIYVYDKRVWDIKPDAFTGEWFSVFIGDQTRQPYIVTDPDSVSPDDRELVMNIPEEYRGEFETDIINSLREIAGVSTLALHPFIMNSSAVADCLREEKWLLTEPKADFQAQNVSIVPSRIKYPDEPRFAHVDLGITGDSAGVTIGCVSGFKEIKRGDVSEMLPMIHIDAILEVPPPKGGEIKFFKIRDLFYKLRDLGLPLRWVSYDSYQSVDSMQILRQNGFITGLASMDTSTLPYEVLKSALYDRRITAPFHEKTIRELLSLEIDRKKGKIDHPSSPGSSKDCSDSLAGVVYGLTMRRELWIRHGVPISSIPTFMRENAGKDKMKSETPAQTGSGVQVA